MHDVIFSEKDEMQPVNYEQRADILYIELFIVQLLISNHSLSILLGVNPYIEDIWLTILAVHPY